MEVILSRLQRPSSIRHALIAVGAAGALYWSSQALNKWLTRRTLNNRVQDPNWDWSKEVVLLTGGSSGIGALVAADLGARGIKVVNVDRNPPQNEHGEQT